MSLATRITLLVTLLLAVCGAGAGVAFHRAQRRTAEAELRGRLDARLAWLEGALEVEGDDGEIELDARDEPAGAADFWQVATADGRVLWSADGWTGAVPSARSVSTVKRLTFGPPNVELLADSRIFPESETEAGVTARGHLVWEKIPMGDVPPEALAAARGAMAVAGAGDGEVELLDARRRARVKKKDRGAPAVFELRGAAAGREYELRVDAAGRVLRARDREAARFPAYAVTPEDRDGDGEPDPVRLTLSLHAAAPVAAMEAELGRTGRLLWTFGPAALALTAALLALLVRWQLRPLARMADQAARIGPANAAERIGPAGSGAELVRLRGSINAMLRRLADALDRERRFAATAAHELRTPLAQMRMALDVALRRPRGAEEYREALQDVSADVERLQRLALGLLQLARGADAGRDPGRPVALAPLLQRAVAERGPARAEGAAAAAGVWVRGDAELLGAAVGNVLDNAARYAPGEPPAVRVEADGSANGLVRVVIADRGPGVPEADRERIFEPLTRLDGGRDVADGASPGFGLGLAVARAAARAYGGDLVCRARADGGAGTEFILTLQRAGDPS